MCVCFFIFYSYSYLIRAGYVVYPRLRVRPATLRGAFLVTFPPVKYLGIILLQWVATYSSNSLF